MTDNYAGLPITDSLDAPNWAATQMAFTYALQQNLVQLVASQAERDSTFSGITGPMFVMNTSDGTCWFHTTSDTWMTLFKPSSGWQDISLDAGYSQTGIDAVQAKAYSADGAPRATLVGRVAADSGTLTGGFRIGQVPANCVPQKRHTAAVGITTQGSITTPTCRLEISPAANWTTKDTGPGAITIWIEQGQTATAWVSINTDYPLD